MSRTALTGTRIRERRLALGLKQANVARDVGVSAPYLNLIEHNRRRIGGRLLLKLATLLDTDVTTLSVGATEQMVGALELAARNSPDVEIDPNTIADFADRTPQWAAVIAGQAQQVTRLEQTVATLSDRLTHDPVLSESLHEILSTAAAIRSTASILAEPGDMDQNWQRRFHENVFEDSKRLAHASQALVQYLDTENDTQGEIRSPQDEVEDILTGLDFHLTDLEQGDDVRDVVQRVFSQVTPVAMELATKFCVSYDADLRNLPLQKLMDAVDQIGLHPAKLAQYLAVSFPLVLRRLASLPRDPRWPDMGLVVCDSSGSLIQKKACAGFSLPRVGAGCVLWPLFTALHQPSVPIHRVIEHQGRPGDQMGPGPAPTFDSYSIAIPRPANDLGAPVVFESTMLVVPRADDDQGAGGAQHVGATCRICSKTDCVARREPNVLSDGF